MVDHEEPSWPRANLVRIAIKDAMQVETVEKEVPESKQHNITISSHDKNLLGIISVFFGAFTGRKSAEANAPKPMSGIQFMTTGDAGWCLWGRDWIWSRIPGFCVRAAAGFQALVALQAVAILLL